MFLKHLNFSATFIDIRNFFFFFVLKNRFRRNPIFCFDRVRFIESATSSSPNAIPLLWPPSYNPAADADVVAAVFAVVAAVATAVAVVDTPTTVLVAVGAAAPVDVFALLLLLPLLLLLQLLLSLLLLLLM